MNLAYLEKKQKHNTIKARNWGWGGTHRAKTWGISHLVSVLISHLVSVAGGWCHLGSSARQRCVIYCVILLGLSSQVPHSGGLNKIHFLKLLEAGSPLVRCWWVWFPPRLADGHLPPRVPTAVSLCTSIPGVFPRVQISSDKDIGQMYSHSNGVILT